MIEDYCPEVNQGGGYMHPSKYAPDEIRNNMFLPLIKKNEIALPYEIIQICLQGGHLAVDIYLD